ncbi:nuclear transport factor 2 family protein [Micromonospora sp. DR5-3]|uniref:nuclear transport factor 2 family protein n=1 Tax=unclassified Micromonospora TaxID=2617518 RepID=UPI0011D94E76|nr:MULTISPECIES: nuclear transport factor 2 family protein [unclassified Micromonospora]MCW3820796.1 nuclear transport factor 2 family protein [Micromonospora sp. DR5-3]TYC11948.1 nuclear transport factor 2 family protein [Micromonospora sp. MP36]
MTDSITTEILELGRRWAEAEQRADVETLDALAVADFALVGPLGFVLDKQQWLDRYRTGDLITASLTWDEVAVRSYGDAAVAIGRHTQQASYRGQPSDGQFRATHIAVRAGNRWQLAGVQLSPIGAFRPPVGT